MSDASAPSKTDVLDAIAKAQAAILAALEQLQSELPYGFGVDGVYVDVIDADTFGGPVTRRFEVSISVAMRAGK